MPQRFRKFVFVGCVGAVVQLGTLALLTKCFHVPLMAATVASVEAAIIQDFLWHERYTWPDRNAPNLGARLLRFHLANGLVSLAGNSLLTQVFVARFHVPTIPAALGAIAICGLVNFALADRWIFAKGSPECGH